MCAALRKNKGDDNVIGKLTSKAAGDIIETLDGWYKIKSGTVTGYIAADPELIATGQEAKRSGNAECYPDGYYHNGCIKRPCGTKYRLQDLDTDRQR